MADQAQTTMLLTTFLRLAPVLTSAVGATYSYAFSVFFGGFRHPEMAPSAKWASMPHWFRSVRAASLRTIFGAYNSSIVLGGANALLFWPSSSTNVAAGPMSWSRGLYVAGTLLTVAYYLYTITLRLVPLNFTLSDDKAAVADRAAAEEKLARLDGRRTALTGVPAAVCFFVAAGLWAGGL
ncbi:uncharacterized protein B0I36DRAFT_366806 [Microdochium trichocladiopsis]|uniref:Uncharacterized protein n=1 Tax=Microdochium trichocladiopsis TaxID=1682393 RepID=A0A9P8XYJ0_9PEZI|nr:uncharacterized protein B0I36DRAFT_366806 [Microdochium trichocladiopsis]KAH7024905.1 hypothetical protein B0I36DRAFT_366806 [Microdochium trichocladiopsis]